MLERPVLLFMFTYTPAVCQQGLTEIYACLYLRPDRYIYYRHFIESPKCNSPIYPAWVYNPRGLDVCILLWVGLHCSSQLLHTGLWLYSGRWRRGGLRSPTLLILRRVLYFMHSFGLLTICSGLSLLGYRFRAISWRPRHLLADLNSYLPPYRFAFMYIYICVYMGVIKLCRYAYIYISNFCIFSLRAYIYIHV